LTSFPTSLNSLSRCLGFISSNAVGSESAMVLKLRYLKRTNPFSVDFIRRFDVYLYMIRLLKAQNKKW
jgi:hypothetical protein